MSTTEPDRNAGGACESCLRRSWLLAELSGPLDCVGRADGRLFELLALAEDELIDALAGRRREELHRRHAEFDERQLVRANGVAELCEHERRYPRALGRHEAPAMLYVTGSPRRLSQLCEQPIVAITGTSRASDYGIEVATGLARGLAVSGVVVAGELADGIGQAAQAGAARSGGPGLAVLAGGVDLAPTRMRPLLELIERNGCAVSELPCGTAPRRWAGMARARTLAALATVTVVVEAEENPRELAAARQAQLLGKTVAAFPGRVTSQASRGAHALLREGAQLITRAEDVLDLIYGADRPPSGTSVCEIRLEPWLQVVLESVCAGDDTPQKLIGDGEPETLLLALTELELRGLLARGDGGRYVPCSALSAHRSRYGVPSQMEP